MSSATRSPSDWRRPQHPVLDREEGLIAGGRTIRYRDVSTFSQTATAARDWNGQLLCSAIYGMMSATVLIGILIGSLDLKFLIAVVFLAAICGMSVIDALGAPRVVVYEIHLALRDGRKATFVDGDERVTVAVAARLRSAGAAEI